MTYYDVIKVLRKNGYSEARYYYGTNTESWTNGDKFIYLEIRDGYTTRQIKHILNER